MSFLLLTLGHTFGEGSEGSKGSKDSKGFGKGFLSLTAFQAEGCGLPLAMLIKSALRDWLSMSYGMIGILLIGSLRSPPPIRLRRTSPCSGGRIKHREAVLS